MRKYNENTPVSFVDDPYEGEDTPAKKNFRNCIAENEKNGTVKWDRSLRRYIPTSAKSIV